MSGSGCPDGAALLELLRRQAEVAREVLALNELIGRKVATEPWAPGAPSAEAAYSSELSTPPSSPTSNGKHVRRPSYPWTGGEESARTCLGEAILQSSEEGRREIRRSEDAERSEVPPPSGGHLGLRQPLLEHRGASGHVGATEEEEVTILDKVQGEWSCAAKQLFNGGVIEFHQDGWVPRVPSHASDSHEWIVCHDHIELIEKYKDGGFRTLRLSCVPGSDDELMVSDESEGITEMWILKRKRGHSLRGSHLTNRTDFQRRVARVMTRSTDIAHFAQSRHFHSGFWGTISHSSWFVNASMLVVLLNALWIAVETDYSQKDLLGDDARLAFSLIDNLFCAFFVFELLVKFMAFRVKLAAFQDTWFLFDSFLVANMVWDTWTSSLLHVFFNIGGSQGGTSFGVLRVFRLLRLARVARTVKLFQFVPELLMLIKGLTVAARSVACTLVMLLAVIYIFAVLFTQLLGSSDIPGVSQLDGEFRTVPWSMHNLFMQVLCGFDAVLITNLLSIGWEFYLLFLLYLLVGYLTILNLLIAIICEVVSSVAQEQKELAGEEDLQKRVRQITHQLDKDSTGGIDEDEFMDLMNQPEVLNDLQSFGVDVVAFMDFVKFSFLDADELSMEDFHEMVKQFRGSKVATVKDVVDIHKFITNELHKLEDRVVTWLARVESIFSVKKGTPEMP